MDRNHQKYNRSISGFSATDEVIDDALPGIIQSGLEECWKDELFFDVEIITCDGSVKSHKIVLASISPFFRAAFSPLHQLSNEVGSNKIDLQIFSTLTVKKILQYVYTKKIELEGSEIEDLVIAANFLQMPSLETICSEFIFENFDKLNIIEMYDFASSRSLIILDCTCQAYIAGSFSQLSNSGLILQLSVDQFENILKRDDLLVKDVKDFIYPPSIQEKMICRTILRYVQAMKSDTAKVATVNNLFQYVRFHLIMKYEFDSLMEEVDAISDVQLALSCRLALSQAVDVNHVKTYDEIEAMGGKLPRQSAWTHSYKTERLAHGYITNIREKFCDSKEGIPYYIKGMKIWIRRWDGRPVYGALEVLYSDGSKVFHGERSNHEVYEFILDPDEFIVEIVAYSGYMIDNLLFITNTGKEYGPYGGDGGGRRVLKAPSKSGYLSYISGDEAFTQGSLGLVGLAFHWVYYVKPGEVEPQGHAIIHSFASTESNIDSDSGSAYELNYE
ncbi:uncharacterized protein LOC135686582 isoform X2 [Rhopilema esculentum]|eukprot:gene949-10714_t